MSTSLGSTGITFPDATTQTTAAAAGYAGFTTKLFTTSTTFTLPTGITQARITVIGAGGAGRSAATAANGGTGGFAMAYCTGISGTLTITVGTTSGATSSITGTGVSISATGGGAATSGVNGAAGAGTVTTGTALRSAIAVAQIATNSIPYGLSFSWGPPNSGILTGAWSASSLTGAGLGGVANTAFAGGVVIIEY